MTTALPTPAPVPTVFQSIEAKALAAEQCVELHLKAITVAGLTKLDQALTGSGTLPFGLDPYKAEVEAFLSDALVLAQLASQLGLISAAPVVPASV